jgi:hypothetical protein
MKAYLMVGGPISRGLSGAGDRATRRPVQRRCVLRMPRSTLFYYVGSFRGCHGADDRARADKGDSLLAKGWVRAAS